MNLWHQIVLSHPMMCRWFKLWLCFCEIHTNHMIEMHAFISKTEFCAVWSAWIKGKKNVNDEWMGGNWNTSKDAGVLFSYFWAPSSWALKTFWHSTGRRNLFAKCGDDIPLFFGIWLTPAGLIVWFIPHLIVKGRKSARRGDSDCNPSVASDLPESL